MSSQRDAWILGGILLAMIAGRQIYTKVRGLRNNNPLNIIENDRVDYAWKGEAVIDLDDQFEVFISPEYGIRAAGRILDSYRRQGVKSLGQIIHRWAPRNENDTDSYLDHVAKQTGWPATFEPDRPDYPRLVAAMIKHENGFNPYSLEFIEQSLQVA